jgi:hypothetical protein
MDLGAFSIPERLQSGLQRRKFALTPEYWRDMLSGSGITTL